MASRTDVLIQALSWQHPWINPAETGFRVPVGTLTPYTGGYDLAGTYEGVAFPSPTGNNYYNVTGSSRFTDCYFKGDVQQTSVIFNESDGCIFEHSTIEGDTSFSSVHGATVRYINSLLCGQDAFHVTGDSYRGGGMADLCQDITLTRCWVHDPAPGVGSHTDSLQCLGVVNLVFTYNLFNPGWIDRPDTPINSALYLQDFLGGTYRPVLIDSNYFNGGGNTLQLQ